MLGTRKKVNGIVEELNKPVDAKVVNGQLVAKRILGRDALRSADSARAMYSEAMDIPPIDPALKLAIERNNQIYAVRYYQDLQSSIPVLGKVIVFFKKIIRRMLFFLIQPVVDEQNAYNASVTQTLNILNNTVETQRTLLVQQENQIQYLKQILANGAATEDVEQLQHEVENIDCNIREIRKKMDIQNVAMSTMKSKISKLGSGSTVQENTDKTEANADNAEIEVNSTGKSANVYDDIDYFAFENAFRGSQDSIRKSQMPYVTYFKEKKNVIDIGCGRGEFLKLLKEEGIEAVGVDLYDEFVLYCKQNGLEAVQGDALAFLQQQENDSLGGIFGAQLVEHLAAGQVEALCRLAYEKLEEGACVILETPNPCCLAIYTNFFYVDPSHVKPVHPETMKYYMKQAGFTDVQIVYTESSRVDYQLPLLQAKGVENLEEVNSGIERVSDLLFGSQDYAIIARK